MSNNEMLLEMQLEIEDYLDQIERTYQDWGLQFDKLTLIARDTSNDNMFILLTTEDYAGLEKACSLVMLQQASKKKEQAP